MKYKHESVQNTQHDTSRSTLQAPKQGILMRILGIACWQHYPVHGSTAQRQDPCPLACCLPSQAKMARDKPKQAGVPPLPLTKASFTVLCFVVLRCAVWRYDFATVVPRTHLVSLAVPASRRTNATTIAHDIPFAPRPHHQHRIVGRRQRVDAPTASLKKGASSKNHTSIRGGSDAFACAPKHETGLQWMTPCAVMSGADVQLFCPQWYARVSHGHPKPKEANRGTGREGEKIRYQKPELFGNQLARMNWEVPAPRLSPAGTEQNPFSH